MLLKLVRERPPYKNYETTNRGRGADKRTSPQCERRGIPLRCRKMNQLLRVSVKKNKLFIEWLRGWDRSVGEFLTAISHIKLARSSFPTQRDAANMIDLRRLLQQSCVDNEASTGTRQEYLPQSTTFISHLGRCTARHLFGYQTRAFPLRLHPIARCTEPTFGH
jgi:hypothetical protein